MKKNKLIAISAMLAVMSFSTSMALAGANLINADTSDKPTYTLSSVFSTENAELDVMQSGENYVTKFNLSDEGKVWLSHNLAYEWRVADATEVKGNTAKFFSFTFAFKTLDFNSISIAMESESAWATKEDCTTNKLTFTKENDNYYVQVNDDESTKKQVALVANQKMVMSFDKGLSFGEFGVNLKIGDGETTKLGTFTNVAGKYGEYVYEKQKPLIVTADMGDDATKKAEVLVYDINGQKFDEATSDKKIYDTAAPVLVVNEEFSSFTLGTTFSLDYTLVDVIQDTNLNKTMEYYQYNPYSVVEEGVNEFTEYKKTFTTSTIIYRMPYTTSNQTTVFDVCGKEFVSIRFSLTDKTFKDADGAYAKAVYDLAWYTDDAVQVDFEKYNFPNKSTLWYVAFDRSESGATYKYLQLDDVNKTNVKVNETDYEAKKTAFDEALAKNAEDVYAGTNSDIYFPSMEWLFDDDNGYRNLKYTIVYRAPGSTANSTKTDVAYNKLQLSANKAGIYEFKVFATDVEDNAMKYYLNGDLVEVTADNIWDIEEIPFFSFSVKKQGLKVDDAKNTKKKETSVKDKSYTMSAFTVVGASTLKSDYALYKIDIDKYNSQLTDADLSKYLSVGDFTSITYEQIAKKLTETGFTLKEANGDYFALYLKAYANLVAEAKNADVNKVMECFEKIGIQGDNKNNVEDRYEKYKWDPASRTFYTAELGNFLVLADYWEDETPSNVRAAAYKVVSVETEKIVYDGEKDGWAKNNVVSIVLFSIAGVLLILIIVLLLVKPSDESLESLDGVKVKKQKEPKNKKSE